MTENGPTRPPAGGPVGMPGPHRRHPHGHRVPGRVRRRLVVGLLALIAVAGVAAGTGMLSGFLPNPVVAGDAKAAGRSDLRGPQTVKAVRPRRDPGFRMSVQRIAAVEPYYQATLKAEVTGVVSYVAKDLGEPVRAHELLAEIDAPELREAVAQKTAIVEQRQRELAVAAADEGVAREAVAAAAVAVKAKSVDVGRQMDLRAARKIEFDSMAELERSGSVVSARLDAARLDFQAARRAVEAAEAAVELAKVEQSGKAASLARAAADVELKRALVEVARKDRDLAAVRLGYARVYAPFDGVVVARGADPGKTVQGEGEPLVTVARVDLVTVVMKLPDNAAGLITPSSGVEVGFQQLPGVTVRGSVTRYSPYIDPADRTMRVEVDVFNGDADGYARLLARTAAQTTLAPLLPTNPLAAAVAAGAGPIRTRFDRKGGAEDAVYMPTYAAGTAPRPVVPGMTATMRVFLDRFADTYVVPAGAVFSRAGQRYVLLVENGTTRGVPVSVQLTDGRLAKIALTESAGGQAAVRELTGDEVIVSARQAEIGDGQKVEPVFDNW
jgi:multidrug resistance efflux pump